MSKSQRDKGKRGELEVANILSDALGREVKRILGQERDSGADLRVGRFVMDVKRQETLKLQEWCNQVEAAADPMDVPVVVYRRNGQPWRVVLRLDDFIPMVRDTW